MAMQRISKMSAYICSLVLSLALIAYLCYNLDVPGSDTSRHHQSEHIYAKVNSLRSLKTRLLLDSYILPYCKSLGRFIEIAGPLGPLLLGKALPHESRFIETTITSSLARDIFFWGGSEFLGLSIRHSVFTIVFLTGFLSINISKRVPKDLYTFEDLDEECQASLSKGTLEWKHVMGDAFTEPNFSKLLCVMVGDGIQIAGTVIATMIVEALGFTSPKSEALLLMCFCLIFGFAAGYVGVWLWRNIKGSSEGWRSLCCSIACLFIISFSIVIALNMSSANGSTAAVCFPLCLALLAPWFGISALLTILGGFMATKSGKQMQVPVQETVQNPREVPARQLRSWFLSVASGALPFTTIFLELFFVFPLFWLGRSYHDYSFRSEQTSVGFLLLAAIFLTVVCAEVSVGSAYRCLCTRDWKWWWKAFFASGSVGIYIFIFSISYLAFGMGRLGRPASVALYLGYSVILAFAVMLSTGAVGFLTAFCFIRYLGLLQYL